MKEKELEKCSIEEIEDMILKHCKKIDFSSYRNIRREDSELGDYLYMRQKKMNDIFEWTQENIEKLLRLNQKLITCFEKIKDEVETLTKVLQKRVDENDSFLHDFEIEARVVPFILVPDEEGYLEEPWDGIELILKNSIEEHVLNMFNVKNLETLGEIIYLKQSQNWNNDWRFEGKFSDYFISQAIHDLYSHTYLSFSDILKINELWAEVHIKHQYFEENI